MSPPISGIGGRFDIVDLMVSMVMVIVSVTERSLYLLNYSAKEGSYALLFKSRAQKESVAFVDICGKS